MASVDVDPNDATEKTPLLPGGGGDEDDDEMGNADLSLIPITEEEKKQFTTDTEPSKQGDSSTPFGGDIEMGTRLSTEQQGASGGTTETSFTTGFDQGHPITLQNMASREIQGEFPKADFTQLDFRYKEAPRSGGLIIEVKYHNSDKWYPLYTKSRGEDEKTLNAGLPKRIKEALGESLTDSINKTNATLQALRTKETEQRKTLQQAETKSAEAQRLRQEMNVIRGRIKDNEDRIQELEDTKGPLDKDAIQKLKDEKRRLAADHQEKRKQLDELAKTAQQKQKLQQDINKTRLSKRETERRLGQLKAQKDAILSLDELKQKAAKLNKHITKDMHIIEDENTSPSESAAARERLTVRNEELEMVNEEIEAQERQRPLLERVKEIFKKYGWTLQAVVLAVGLVLGALALAGLNGLKAGTKAVGQGLKAIGQKLGSSCPGSSARS